LDNEYFSWRWQRDRVVYSNEYLRAKWQITGYKSSVEWFDEMMSAGRS
jgi:hypothetical protein